MKFSDLKDAVPGETVLVTVALSLIRNRYLQRD